MDDGIVVLMVTQRRWTWTRSLLGRACASIARIVGPAVLPIYALCARGAGKKGRTVVVRQETNSCRGIVCVRFRHGYVYPKQL